MGSFAVPGAGEPDFRTPFGTAIANQSQLIGYPAGTVNRHYFSGWAQNGGTGTAMSRNRWTPASNLTLDENSYLNMAVEANVDVQTRELTVHVEGYYTGDSPEPSNKLNVALIQNNTLGPQVGGGMGDQYVHQHRLVYLLTTQWGDDVNTTTTGSFVDRTYTYTIPADYNGIPAELADMELVVFMTETTQEIISGNGTFPLYTNLEFQDDVALKDIKDIPEQCVNAVGPTVVIQNTGANEVTSVAIEYSINGGTTHTYTWNGSLTSLQYTEVELPAIAFEFAGTNNVEVTIPNDEDNSNNQVTTSFNDAQEYVGDLTLTITTDNWGSECTWNIKDYEGNIVANGGPYANNTTITETITLTEENCYTFNLIDSYGDGGGPVTLEDSNATIIYQTNGSYGSGESKNFGYQQVVLGTNTYELSNVVMFPNPAQNSITIANAENASVAIFNMLGQQIAQFRNIATTQQLDVANLTAGTYLVKITKEGASTVKKLVVSK